MTLFDTVDKHIRNVIDQKIDNRHLAGKAWVNDKVRSFMENNERIATLERQVKKLFAIANEVRKDAVMQSRLEEVWENVASCYQEKIDAKAALEMFSGCIDCAEMADAFHTISQFIKKANVQ